MAKQREWMVVVRRIHGGDDGWIEANRIIDVSKWRTAKRLQDQRYLRPRAFGEDGFKAADGTLWLTEGHAKFAGAPVGSSATSPDLGPQADESKDEPQGSSVSDEDEAEEDEEAEGDAADSEEEDAEDESEDDSAEDTQDEDESELTRTTDLHSYSVDEIGAGWYNVLDEHGTVLNTRALHGKGKAVAFMDEQE